MPLNELSAGGDWRAMWNREVLPYLRSQYLVAAEGVRLDRRPAGTWIRVQPTASETETATSESGYSSYFKLTLAQTDGGPTVTIADGATGGDSTAVVNGYSTYSIPPYSEIVSGDRLFFLKYTPTYYDASGSVITAATLVIASLGPQNGAFPRLPAGGTDGAYYMQLGRCLWNGGSPRVVQDHTAGVAEFLWFVACNRYTS